jgi:hypothetical protein
MGHPRLSTRDRLNRLGARCQDCSRSVSQAARRTRRAFSTQRALHGICRQAWLATQGLGWASGYRYRVIGTLARSSSSIPSAVGLVHRPCGPVWCRRTSLHFQRCSFRHQRITLCHTKFSRELMVCLATACRKSLDQPRMIWLNRISTVLGGCCDSLLVRARTFPCANGKSVDTRRRRFRAPDKTGHQDGRACPHRNDAVL